jgi:hypothetical protein
MLLRQDIIDYVKLKYSYSYNIYEKDNILYNAECCTTVRGNNEITNYCYLSTHKNIKDDLIKTFGIEFKGNDMESIIVCRCGETDYFKAFYCGYSLELECTKCNNNFVAYSG